MTKAAAAAISAAFAGILIKRTNPELSFSLTALTAAAVMLAAIGFLEGFSELVRTVRQLSGTTDKYILPVIKCAAIGIITKLTTALCRDSGQSSVAVSVELAGAISALTVSMPLVMSMLRMLGTLI